MVSVAGFKTYFDGDFDLESDRRIENALESAAFFVGDPNETTYERKLHLAAAHLLTCQRHQDEEDGSRSSLEGVIPSAQVMGGGGVQYEYFSTTSYGREFIMLMRARRRPDIMFGLTT